MVAVPGPLRAMLLPGRFSVQIQITSANTCRQSSISYLGCIWELERLKFHFHFVCFDVIQRCWQLEGQQIQRVVWKRCMQFTAPSSRWLNGRLQQICQCDIVAFLQWIDWKRCAHSAWPCVLLQTIEPLLLKQRPKVQRFDMRGLWGVWLWH